MGNWEPSTVDYEADGGKPRRTRLYATVALLAAAAVAAGLYVSYELLVWHVLEQMYAAKLGLDWFGTVFFGGYAFVVPAAFAFAVVYPFPRRSDLFALLRAANDRRLEYSSLEAGNDGPSAGGATSRNIWLAWQVVKWVGAYLAAYYLQGFFFYPNVTETIEFDLHGIGSWAQVPRLFSLPLFPASGSGLVSLVPTMETQYYILVAAVGSVLLVLAVRFSLRLVTDYLYRKTNAWIIDLIVVGLLVSASVWLGAPYWLMNAFTPYIYGFLLTVMFGLAYGIMYFRLSGKGLVPINKRRRTLVRVVAVLVVVLLVANLGSVALIGVNWNNNWLGYAWTPQVQKQINVTRWAAGLQGVNTSDIASIPQGNESQILGLVRQWDQNASLIRSEAQIGVNYLSIPNSQIVYLKGQQYWVQPTTITYPPGHTDWISEHLIYTHSDRVIVINAHTGAYSSLSQALGLQANSSLDNPLIYYGQGSGFNNNVYVNVKNEPAQVGNATYLWKPDYVLSGAQRALWFFVRGPTTWGFAFSPPQNNIDMLVNRDVLNRVSQALVPGLTVDPQTFLVTDGTQLYFAVMVYINYPLQTGFAQADYLRNFAVVLVNVNDGSMHPYLVNNCSSFLCGFFKQYYPTWNQAPPAWLVPQLRYPDQLLGTQTAPGQLDADFLYHVDTSQVWRSGSNFYERPAGTYIYYVLVNKGNQLSYVGIQLAEFSNSPGHNLGGIYIVYGGAQLGKMYLYQVNPSSNSTEKLFGPSAALSAVSTNPQIREQMTLLNNPTQGNVLPYLIGGQLYYFIPYYVNAGASANVITKLAFMAVVDGSNGVSTYGPSSASAFASLLSSENKTAPVVPGSVTVADVASSFRSAGYNVTQPSFVNVNVGYRTGTVTLSNATVSSVQAAVSSFVSEYAVPAHTQTIYEWTQGNSTDFGVISTSSGFSEAYYIQVVR
ncbi:MAG: hypothetical protein JRN25_07275 [Nitrososphaerota archaeon]|nr:hypothetical protein [Nitrososphaerota archaeon]MDG6962083.1 hypothetical protein [Nitrososphaerota archaeon]MDG6962874.1 hypothetical protein [Nitrososphaerota archaeon]MDG7018101.1 hypothetical protein [Nitrososphaerota archaeon]MDG7019876.1 hypothetical protein [Nitrososphaerota archaeon]